MADIQYRSVQKKEIVVLGAGVIGLTTAIVIQEQGDYHVTVIANVFPGDERNSEYTSQWAGAYHVPQVAGHDTRLQKINRETFEYMWKLSEPGKGLAEGCFLRIKQQELYQSGYESNRIPDYYPSLRELSKNDLTMGAVRGVEFETITIDAPLYLHYLQARFLSRGGKVSRGTVQHIDQLLEGGPYVFHHDYRTRVRLERKVPIDGLVICAGLGARALGGVEDQDLFPTRGQTVVLRAPWVRVGRALTGEGWAYVIPRRNGDIIVGGVKEIGDWYPMPRSETRMDILKRGLALLPELAPPAARMEREPTVDDLLPLIIEDGCGLRPSREGGPRLEATQVEVKDGRTIPLVFNYGHAGHGYISSWGSASAVLKMLMGGSGKLSADGHTF